MNAQVYDRITERIIALLDARHSPLAQAVEGPHRIAPESRQQKPYRGINVFLLMAMSYESPFWLTFRQALQLGGTVHKGEKSCPVVFWKQTTVEDKESGEEQKIPLLRLYHVFNVAQCDGLKTAPGRWRNPSTASSSRRRLWRTCRSRPSSSTA